MLANMMLGSYSDDLLLAPSAFQFDQEEQNKNVYTCESITQTKVKRNTNASTNTTIDIKDLTEVKDYVNENIQSNETENQVQILHLQSQLKNSESSKAHLQTKLFDCDNENQRLKDELDKMKLYVSGVANRGEWVKEKTSLLSQIDMMKGRNDELEKFAESEHKQKRNMEKLVELQESRLIAEHTANNNQMSIYTDPRDMDKFDTLLSGWRQKVLSLLVQQESMKLEMERDRQIWKDQYHQIEMDLKWKDVEQQKLHLHLDNSQSQVESLNMIVQRFSLENSGLQYENDQLQEANNISVLQLDKLNSAIENFDKIMQNEVLEKYSKLVGQVERLDRRIEYAISRFPLIKAGLVRKLNLNSQEPRGVTDTHYTHSSIINGTGKNTKIEQVEEALVLLKKELDTVREERDKLCAIIQSDSKTFQERVEQKRSEIDEEMTYLKATVENLKIELNKVNKMKDVIEKENCRLTEELNKCMSEKLTEREKHQMKILQKQDELSKYQQQVGHQQKLIAKEKVGLEKKLESSIINANKTEQKWIHTCKQIQAENDMLKTTIRQQGLLKELDGVSTATSVAEKEKKTDKNVQKQDILQEIKTLAGALDD